MRRVAVVQARMTSTRLPGKVLMDLAGRPMLAQQLRRLKECRSLDGIVLATTTNASDDPVAELGRAEGVGVFRGSEHDVLGRYLAAAVEAAAEVVVRITADCPLIDPAVTDRVVEALTPDADYASNVLRRTWPRGLDAEALFLDTLRRLDRMARSPAAREHVTVFLRTERPELFACRSVEDDADNSDLRLTVDTSQDLDLVRAVYEALDLGRRVAGHREVVAFLRAHPEIARRNAGAPAGNPA